MMRPTLRSVSLGAVLLLGGGGIAASPAHAQDKLAPQQPPAAQPQTKDAQDQSTDLAKPASSKAPDALDLYFDTNSSKIRPQDLALLDKASRLYAEGKPIVMVVAGSADLVGSPALNLKLSQARADGVVRGLVERGIPVERFQILAKGVSELPVQTAANVVEPRNRRVEITWR